MRIRSIRPEFWSSEDVAAMDWHTRLVFIGLWSYVDDNGVGRDVERLITTALFPLDDDLRECSGRVTGALRHLSDHGQITRYVVDGKPYLHITAWSKHQRIEKASKGRYPSPTCENAEIVESSPTTPGALPDMSTPGEGEKGRRGEGEKTGATTPPPRQRGSRIADDFTPSQELIQFAASLGFNPAQAEAITAEFVDYWRGVAGAKGVKLDWDGTWRNWVRKQDPARVRIVATSSSPQASWTEEQLTTILGPDRWRAPQPPPEVPSEQQWDWVRAQLLDHRQDRIRQAIAKQQGGVA